MDEEEDFVWQDYLDATRTIEVPQINFHHVELTLQNGIEIGMSLEVPVGKDSEDENIYWVATIVMACGPLLRLRYFGANDRSLEFWFNLTKEAAHELGWSALHRKAFRPPDAVLEKSPDCLDKLHEFLQGAVSVPSEMLSGEGLSMVERIKEGIKVEINDVQHPYKLWVATIMENVGGRLLLRYDTPGAQSHDFWIFCTSESLHTHGFASKTISKFFLEPPSSILDTHSYEEWKEMIETSQVKDEKLPSNLFNYSTLHAHHKFTVGMKLEALLPSDRTKILPATVVKVFDEVYFLVQIDDLEKSPTTENGLIYDSDEKSSWLCTVDHPYIFPVGWAKKNNIDFDPPKGWEIPEQGEFDWKNYLKITKSTAASVELFPQRESAVDAGFEVNMRLEAVDPRNEGVICAAHISKITQDLLWISLDSYDDNYPNHIVHMRSMQIFPVGWCESNLFPLESPKNYAAVCKKIDIDDKKVIDKKYTLDIPESKSSSWCPKIYFNYRCCTGPMISKGKLATLPKSVGPGRVDLVMREVLSMIVSVGYRTSRILKVLQSEDTKPEPGYNLEVLKAKHKNNTYRANVAVVTSGDMVSEFCRSICKKLMVCPNLFGPQEIIEDRCPDKCQKSRHKYTSSSSSAAAAAAPVSSTPLTVKKNCVKPTKVFENNSILEQKQKPWGKRRKKKKTRLTKDNENQDDESAGAMDLDKNQSDDVDRQITMSEIDIMIKKNYKKSKKNENGRKNNDVPSSNASDDSRSSFNDRKSKESNCDSKSNTPKTSQNGSLTKSIKRERDFEEDSAESEASDNESEYVKLQHKQRRPKTRKLDSNPLFWTVDDVFRYLRKTPDCRDIAYRVRQEEIDGLAFLLLNLPSLTQHMHLRTITAMKLCRHVEQVKVTFFLRHINETESSTSSNQIH